MISEIPKSLELIRMGLRFEDPSTERSYRHWRAEHGLFLIMLGGIVSASAWALTTVGAYLWMPDIIHQVWPVTMSVVAAFVVVLSLIRRPALIRIRFSLVMLMILSVGMTLLWLYITLGEPISGLALSLSSAVSILTISAFFTAVMQMPPKHALISTAPFLGTAIYMALNGYWSGHIDRFITGALVAHCVISLGFVMVICMLIERNIRLSFIKDRVIDQQKESLTKSANLVRRYVPPAVADHIFKDNADAIDRPQRRRVTVLFCDIVGFTDIADRVEPEVMTEVLNDYMSAMADLIEQHGGTLNEFAGDGLMALFGAPDAMAPEDQARNAIQAAQAMQSKMPELNEQWRKLGLGAELKTRIGINTGMVSVGSYGSQGRMTYTAIGLQTNIASRIESAAEPGQTLISDATYQLISDDMTCEPKGEVECKGVHFPVKVYAPQ